MEPMKSLELTPQQKAKWGDIMSFMAWTAPGFRHLFYKLLSNNDGQYVAVMTREVPIAATDGKNILLNPDTFFDYPIPEAAFILNHEILHNVYGDVELLHRCKTANTVPMNNGTTKPFDMQTMQHAMDYRINALLRDSNLGKPPKKVLLDDKYASANDSVLDVYERLYKSKKGNGQGQGQGQGNGQGDGQGSGQAFDQVLPPGKSTGQSPQQAAAQRNEQQWSVETSAAQTLERMKSQGKMPGALQRMFEDLLTPKVPWQDHIKALFARRLGSGSSDWRRPDRRFIWRDLYLPSKSGHGAGWIAVWGDTSGSIGEDELNAYMAELGSIIEDVRPRKITVYWCDSKIHHEDEITDTADLAAIKARGVGGGGGTSCKPVFDKLHDNVDLPDVLVCFTDGYVTFPKRQAKFPVIWASTTDVEYPFGDVVRINP